MHSVSQAMELIFSFYGVALLLASNIDAFSGQPQSSKNPVRVLVTGAAGKTGRIVLSKLEEDHRYEPKGLFRTEKSARRIVKNVDTKCPLEHVVIADVTSPTFLDDLSSSNDSSSNSNDHHSETTVLCGKTDQSEKCNGLAKMDAMIICTSAVPRIRKRSLAAMLVLAPWRALRGKPIMNVRSMRFAWKHGDYPEKVDYKGQKAQIDLAKRLGIPHVVLISSMGGTNPDNFLNSVGKHHHQQHQEEEKDKQLRYKQGEGHGDILLWKRKAEKYLVESGLDYTILHPGGLVDSPGGKGEFVFGVDDHLLELNHNEEQPAVRTRISRSDIADLCVAALSAGKGKKVSLDCITVPSSTRSTLMGHGHSFRMVSPGMGIPEAKGSESGGRKSKSKRKPVNLGSDIRSRSSTTAATPTATLSPDASTTAEARLAIETEKQGRQKSAEESLSEFVDLSITANYDLGVDKL